LEEDVMNINGILYITYSKIEDSGEYECFYPLNGASERVTLRIVEKKKVAAPVEMSKVPEEHHLQENDDDKISNNYDVTGDADSEKITNSDDQNNDQSGDEEGNDDVPNLTTLKDEKEINTESDIDSDSDSGTQITNSDKKEGDDVSDLTTFKEQGDDVSDFSTSKDDTQ
jgi:hypothetical protein